MKKRSKIEQDVDRELREKGLLAHEDFDHSQILKVSGRRGESKMRKSEKLARLYFCGGKAPSTIYEMGAVKGLAAFLDVHFKT